MHWTESFGNSPAGQVESQKVLWKLLLVVEPEGEKSFEAEVEEMLSWRMNIEPSDRHYQFVVLYDPSNHAKVVIDHSDVADRMLDVNQLEEQTDAQVGRMRQRGQDVLADRYKAAQDSLASYMGQDRSDLTADQREDALHAQQQKMREIMAGDSMQRAEQIRAISHDPSIPPEQKRAKIMELMAAMPGSNAMIAGEPSAAAGAPSPVAPALSDPVGASASASNPAAVADALTKLADLRDRGVLSEAEFQAQKTKLLGA